jgi:hypothetical protein
VTEQRIAVTVNIVDDAMLLQQRQQDEEPCVSVVFVRTSAFSSPGALATRLAKHLREWPEENPAPYEGFHWP